MAYQSLPARPLAARIYDARRSRDEGLHIFARDVSLSHGFAHLEDFDPQVNVLGMDVHPGDLVHADERGAVVIPQAIAAEVAARGREIEKSERGSSTSAATAASPSPSWTSWCHLHISAERK